MPRSLFDHILVPYDFSPQADAALTTAAGLAKEHGGKITVLYVIAPFYLPPGTPYNVPTPVDLVPDQRAHLERVVAKKLGADGPPAKTSVELGDPAQCIVDAAGRATSVVMATTGRSGLAHLIIGSVAEKVVRHSPIPVVTLRIPSKKPRGSAR